MTGLYPVYFTRLNQYQEIFYPVLPSLTTLFLNHALPFIPFLTRAYAS